MIFQSLASSSKGNAYRVVGGETSIMLECGLTFKKLSSLFEYRLTENAACFITHEHGDHSRAVKQIIKVGIPVYMSFGTARALELLDAEIIDPGIPVSIGDLRVMAFPVNHDAAQPIGFLIDEIGTGERLFFAADTRNLNYVIANPTQIAVECNYEESLLAQQTKIPEKRKDRIRHSHFEVRHVIAWLHKQDLSKTTDIYLLHLSAGNSRAAAWRTVFEREFPGIHIRICKE
mgnify:FL=1